MTTFFGLRSLVSASIIAAFSLALISQAKAQDGCNFGRGPNSRFGNGLQGQTNFYGSPGSHHFGGGYRDHDHRHSANFRNQGWDRDHDRFGRGSYNRFDYANHDGYHDRFRNTAFRNPAYPGFAPPYGVTAPYTPYNASPYSVNPYAAPTYSPPVVVPTTPVTVPTTTLPNNLGYGRGINLTTPNGFGFGLNF